MVVPPVTGGGLMYFDLNPKSGKEDLYNFERTEGASGRSKAF